LDSIPNYLKINEHSSNIQLKIQITYRLLGCFIFLFGGWNVGYTQNFNGDSNSLNYTVDAALAPNRIAIVNQIMDEAIAMLDRPYRAGGKTPSGFDCSGFVSYCYLQGNDQKLPVSSREYINKGKPIDIADALPGDVILFSGRRAIQTLVGHVGIISEVSDDIYFIHSATSSGIRFDRMSSPYYQKRFIGIRRF